MRYAIEYARAAVKAIRKMDRRSQRRVLAAIGSQASDPRPAGSRKLTGGGDEHRIRVGPHRVVYAVEDERLLVLVLEAGHRKDIYEIWRRGR